MRLDRWCAPGLTMRFGGCPFGGDDGPWCAPRHLRLTENLPPHRIPAVGQHPRRRARRLNRPTRGISFHSMKSRLRRWIALLALLFVPVTGTAASPLCTEMGMGAPGAEPAAVHHGHGGGLAHHAQAPSHDDGRSGEDGRRDPASPACPLMMAGAGGCLGGFLSAASPRAATDAVDRPSFLVPVQPRPRLSAASLFRPPRA